MKKAKVFLCLIALVLIMQFASAEKLSVSPLKETFSAGESINLRVSLLDSTDSPIDGNVDIVFEDSGQSINIERTVQTNIPVEINLGEGMPAGLWKVSAVYENLTSAAFFIIGLNEIVEFNIKDNILSVINMGNTPYRRTIYIIIGETVGSKEIDLDVGESATFRLVAPSGNYNIKVTDGKTTLVTNDVSLTGNVVGVLDNEEVSTSPLTSRFKGEDPAYGEDNLGQKNNSLAYLFIFVVFAAAVLLMIERKMKKSAYS